MVTKTDIKFKGSVTSLHTVLKEIKVVGKFRKLTNNHWQYHAFMGAVLNFYQRNGTIYVQGEANAKSELEALIIDHASKSISEDFDSSWYLGKKRK